MHYLQSTLLHAVEIGVVVLLIIAAFCDIAMRIIPNWLPALVAGFGVVLQFMSGHLFGAVVISTPVFIAAVLCWRRNWLGGGDVKLISAATIIAPPWLVPELLVVVALAGGILALVYLALRIAVPAPAFPRPSLRLRRILRIEQWRIRRSGPLPYATAIAAGTIFTMFAS